MKPFLLLTTGVLIGATGFAVWSHNINKTGSTESSLATPIPPIELGPEAHSSLASGQSSFRSRKDIKPEGRAAIAKGLSSALSVKRITERTQLIFALLNRIEPSQFGELLNGTHAMGLSLPDKRLLSNAIFQKWTEVDPRAATTYLSTLSTFDQMANIDSLASAWSSYDPQSALAWSQTLTSSQARASAVGQVLSKLVAIDSNAALSALAKLDRNTAMLVSSQLYGAWVEKDPQAAVNAAVSQATSGVLGDRAIRAIGTKWAQNDPSAALNFLSENPQAASTLGTNFALAIVSSAAGVDPRATMESLMENSAFGANTRGLRIAAVTNWMIQDPETTQQWLNNQPSDLRAQIVLDAASAPGGRGVGPDAWLQLLAGLPASTARTTAFQNLVQSWSTTQPDAALQYLTKVNDSSLTSQIMPKVLTGLAKTDPELAFRTAMDLPDPATRKNALMSVTAVWTNNNASQATAQITALPESQDRTTMVISAASSWARSNPQAASDWAANLSDNTLHDNALSAIAATVSPQLPELALANAKSISNPTLQQAVMNRITGSTPPVKH